MRPLLQLHNPKYYYLKTENYFVQSDINRQYSRDSQT
jgi:hypothetical protein